MVSEKDLPGLIGRYFRTVCEVEIIVFSNEEIPLSEIITIQRQLLTMRACVRQYCKTLAIPIPQFIDESPELN